MAVKESTFIDLLKAALEFGASDIHIREGEPPSLRIHGDLIPIKSPPVKRDDIESILQIVERPELIKAWEGDGGKTFEGVCRIRFNYFKFQEKLGIIIRLIKKNIPSIQDLQLSPTLAQLATKKRGLILITGATGSGKSTTLAALLDLINQTRDGHIVTIEDPVEYLFEQKRCRITQREVGIDTENFALALRGALRQDPNVIAIGEMRDLETVDICLKASETGHLVISTIHTNNAENTISRILSLFPPEAQKDARIRLSENLTAIISQRLIKRLDGKGRIVAQEIMISTPGIRDCISGKDDMKNFYTYIRESHQSSHNGGGQTFDQHLVKLLKNKIISKEEAILAAANGQDFAKLLELED